MTNENIYSWQETEVIAHRWMEGCADVKALVNRLSLFVLPTINLEEENKW
jgi:hypothetical protein